MKNILIILFSSFSISMYASDKAMEQAKIAYDSARYEESIRIYDSLTSAGVYDYALFYNKGNAWFRMSEPAKAILNYEKALLINPLAIDALNNLDMSLKALGFDAVSGERKGVAPLLNKLSMSLDANVWYVLFLAAWFCVFAFIALARLQGKQWPYWLSGITLLMGICFLLLGISHVNRLHSADTAIALKPSVLIREAPTPDGKKITSVPEGTHMEILRSKSDDGWLEVSINTLQGWVNVDDVGVVTVLGDYTQN